MIVVCLYKAISDILRMADQAITQQRVDSRCMLDLDISRSKSFVSISDVDVTLD